MDNSFDMELFGDLFDFDGAANGAPTVPTTVCPRDLELVPSSIDFYQELEIPPSPNSDGSVTSEAPTPGSSQELELEQTSPDSNGPGTPQQATTPTVQEVELATTSDSNSFAASTPTSDSPQDVRISVENTDFTGDAADDWMNPEVIYLPTGPDGAASHQPTSSASNSVAARTPSESPEGLQSGPPNPDVIGTTAREYMSALESRLFYELSNFNASVPQQHSTSSDSGIIPAGMPTLGSQGLQISPSTTALNGTAAGQWMGSHQGQPFCQPTNFSNFSGTGLAPQQSAPVTSQQPEFMNASTDFTNVDFNDLTDFNNVTDFDFSDLNNFTNAGTSPLDATSAQGHELAPQPTPFTPVDIQAEMAKIEAEMAKLDEMHMPSVTANEDALKALSASAAQLTTPKKKKSPVLTPPTTTPRKRSAEPAVNSTPSKRPAGKAVNSTPSKRQRQRQRQTQAQAPPTPTRESGPISRIFGNASSPDQQQAMQEALLATPVATPVRINPGETPAKLARTLQPAAAPATPARPTPTATAHERPIEELMAANFCSLSSEEKARLLVPILHGKDPVEEDRRKRTEGYGTIRQREALVKAAQQPGGRRKR
ncbi:hypothetical protein BU26DRAFT_589194 [Trematosphaeria pertusa]|uniref:Uncharacterized protein n=1 Tax=Trematosphaeria pertusa TaxID=390896 RepID=A0A6A6IUG0_9PLEO|nr:uncharacterized protein BU26DRAFT_589194 [Trematosphaeria pertusa]KAF2254039.1 hypothetical protein BU26DRAFT_589194 [Trematosphaeria pertusa]